MRNLHKDGGVEYRDPPRRMQEKKPSIVSLPSLCGLRVLRGSLQHHPDSCGAFPAAGRTIDTFSTPPGKKSSARVIVWPWQTTPIPAVAFAASLVTSRAREKEDCIGGALT
ncbi:MAG: hypothetical protein L0Y71_21010 [Gemmataceae bacterium]|nr:hypothetical protein [Gemmataceae bacterium]